MKSDIENLSTTRVKMTVELDFDELSDDLTNAYREIAKQVNVPGFRKGRVPNRVIDQRFGRGSVLSEVMNAVIPRTYEQIIIDNEIVPLGQPDVEVTKIEDGDVVEFTAELDVRPDFDIPAFDAIAVEVEAIAEEDEAVAEQLEQLRTRFASYNPVERPAANGDVLLVDVQATRDGEEVEEFSAEALSYELGSGGAVEGFDEAVEGAEAAEIRTFEHIPAEGDHAGETISVSVTVTAVRERVLPEADDDFAVMASEFDTIDELRADLEEKAGRMGLMRQSQQAREKIHEALLDLVEFDLPEGPITEQIDQHFADGHGDDEHREETEKELRTNLKSQLLLDKIAEDAEIQADESQLTQWLFAQAPRYGMQPDELAKALVENGQVEMAIADVRRGQALSLVVEAATVTDEAGQAVDLEELNRLINGGSAVSAPQSDESDEVEISDDSSVAADEPGDESESIAADSASEDAGDAQAAAEESNTQV